MIGMALLAGIVWIPFAGRTLSPDEGGLLLLAGQWGHGSSLYGDYFVDRPPGLIAIAAAADAAGGGWALRTFGILAVVASVVLAGAIGRLAAPGREAAPLLTAATAAALVATPLFGGTVVNGELLGLPFLLGGIAATLAAVRSPDRSAALAWAALGGIVGACGALVKQSLLDVFVLAAVLLLAHRQLRLLTATVAGGAATVAIAVGGAWLAGTSPGDLWDAVIVFRQQAAAVIADSATDTTPTRLGVLLLALLGSGAPLLAVLLGRRLRAATGEPDLRWAALATLAWELAVVLLGGSYWLHYLMGLVPGLVLLTAAAVQRPLPSRRTLLLAYVVPVVSTTVALAVVLVHPIARSEQPAIDWLRANGAPGDTAVVAFGAPNILEETGMTSPYPDLWSLPVRVHDPDLERLVTVLEDPDRPRWVVVAGSSLGTWGVDATVADRVLAEHYAQVTTTGGWTIYEKGTA